MWRHPLGRHMGLMGGERGTCLGPAFLGPLEVLHA